MILPDQDCAALPSLGNVSLALDSFVRNFKHGVLQMTALPYVTAPGNIDRALNGIKSAATPERVSQDFVKTILKVPGGSGDQMTSYLKKIGFTNADGTPSDLYKRFRNPSSSGRAAADALDCGYSALKKRNEFWYQLPDDKLKGLIIEETGQKSDSGAVSLPLACIKAIKKFANRAVDQGEEPKVFGQTLPAIKDELPRPPSVKKTGLGMNLSYTINLNLPSTSDPAVFNAIFKSLKENLLESPDDES